MKRNEWCCLIVKGLDDIHLITGLTKDEALNKARDFANGYALGRQGALKKPQQIAESSFYRSGMSDVGLNGIEEYTFYYAELLLAHAFPYTYIFGPQVRPLAEMWARKSDPTPTKEPADVN